MRVFLVAHTNLRPHADTSDLDRTAAELPTQHAHPERCAAARPRCVRELAPSGPARPEAAKRTMRQTRNRDDCLLSAVVFEAAQRHYARPRRHRTRIVV